MIVALVLSLLGCSSPPPTGPSPEASDRAAAKLCELFQSAGKACAVQPRDEASAAARVKAAGREIALTAVVEEEQSALGITSIVMRVEPGIDGEARPELVTPAAGSGFEDRDALLEGAYHEWAVVYGAAIVDALLADPERPALRALGSRDEAAQTLGDRPVYRGWSLLQGTSERSLDHAQVLGHLAPALADLGPGWHGVGIRIDHEPGATRFRCAVDGREAPAVCEAARRYAWPIGGPMSRVRQFYVIAPAP